MKRKILYGIFVLALTGAAAWNLTLRANNGLSDVTLAKVEALAKYELPEVVITCNAEPIAPGKCWKDLTPVWFPAKQCEFSGMQEDYCWLVW